MSENTLKFNPIPKRFMVWDKRTNGFVRSPNIKDTKVFDLIDLKDFLKDRWALNEDLGIELILSTNTFDEDDEEIWEGSLVRDYDGEVGVACYNTDEGGYLVRSTNGNSWRLDSTRLMKVIGHALSNPELLEEEE